MSAIDHVEVTCAACGAPILLHRSHEQKLRRTHASFWCSNGHSNYFPGKTAEEKRIESLERQIEHSREHLHESHEREDRLRELTRAVQVCPMGCGFVSNRRVVFAPTPRQIGAFLDRVWSDLREHLIDHHGAVLPDNQTEESQCAS